MTDFRLVHSMGILLHSLCPNNSPSVKEPTIDIQTEAYLILAANLQRVNDRIKDEIKGSLLVSIGRY